MGVNHAYYGEIERKLVRLKPRETQALNGSGRHNYFIHFDVVSGFSSEEKDYFSWVHIP